MPDCRRNAQCHAVEFLTLDTRTEILRFLLPRVDRLFAACLLSGTTGAGLRRATPGSPPHPNCWHPLDGEEFQAEHIEAGRIGDIARMAAVESLQPGAG